MNPGKAIIVAITAFVAVMLFCTLACDADEAEATPVFSPLPSPMPDQEPPLDVPDAPPVEPPMILDAKVVPADLVPFIPMPDEDEVPEEVPDTPIPVPFLPAPEKQPVFHKVIRLDYASVLNLELLMEDLISVVSKDEDDEDDAEDEFILIVDVEEENAPLSDYLGEPIGSEVATLFASEPVFYSEWGAVGPIFCF